MQIVIVKFLDPTTFHDWVPIDFLDHSKPKLCEACGLLWEENEDVVKVGLLTDEDKETASDWIVIPVGCVKSIEVVKELEDG